MGQALRKNLFLIVATLLIVNIVVVNPSGTASSSEGTIVVDGYTLSTEVPPTIIDGRMMVPMRPIFEALGAKVTWDGANQAVSASKDDREVYLEINNSEALLGSQRIKLEVAPYVLQGRT